MTNFSISDDDRRELVDAFIAETDDVLNELEQSLLRLEQTPDDDQLLHDIFRGVHTLKGNAGCLQYDDLTRFAHVMEELLDGMREGRVDANAARVSQLLDVVDALRDISVRSVSGNGALTDAQEALMLHVAQWASGADATPADPARTAASSQSSRTQVVRNLRVGIDKLDRMLNLVGEIATARGNVRQLIEETRDEKSLDAVRELDRLSFDLQEAIMNVRLVPVGPSLRHFHRIVRDLAASQGKRVALVIEGEDVEVDTTVIEQLKDPITHMIRNAIDHGIEQPQFRVAAGKEIVGTIRITALHQSGGIVFRIADDGAGLNDARIAERCRALGIDPDRLTRQELRDMTLRPGFSTAHEVTDLSGRGVGMDVVRRNVESLRGTLSIDSQPGAGTTIDIRLPLTVAVIDGFAVGVGDETYVIPIDNISECTELPEGAVDATGVISLRGEPLPYLRIQSLFGLDSIAADRENVVVVEHEHGRAGIVVDQLFGSSQVVMKPMGRFLRQVPGVSGSSILGNGRVALILDVREIIRRAAETAQAQSGSL
ncbi:MAG: two-component system, chemotaxis family, sensor kinase CheA [Acidobacteriota bacterium]|jgi:two-component system chemotaxis sensor kinase CheA|nr:two-component system, chemotaxis family, sensor kinase CheA [Acidobacteriota bacterium]